MDLGHGRPLTEDERVTLAAVQGVVEASLGCRFADVRTEITEAHDGKALVDARLVDRDLTEAEGATARAALGVVFGACFQNARPRASAVVCRHCGQPGRAVVCSRRNPSRAEGTWVHDHGRAECGDGREFEPIQNGGA